MSEETKIALDCPYCNTAIYETPAWFKKPYTTCPHCDQGLAAGQFAAVLADLEQAMEDSIEEMLYGKQHGCCGQDSCCNEEKSAGDGSIQ